MAPENRLQNPVLDPVTRERLPEWEREAGLAVSTFRRELTRWGDTEGAEQIIEEIRAHSADFARMWEAHDVGTLGEGVKRLTHPTAGDLAIWYSSYAIDDEPGLGLVLYTPDTADDARRMRQLLEG